MKDTGIGIPAERMDRLFQAFSQVDASTTRQYGGTGLGLAISKRLIEMMGGSIWVESEPGLGASFHFTIQANSLPGQPRYLYGRAPQLAGNRLLIVDDNATNLRALSLQTEVWGMRPRVATSGAEALDWLDQGTTFDIAMLDLQMPGMDGIQLARQMRARPATADLPLILLASFGQREPDSTTGLFVAHLAKPVKLAQLYDALNHAAGGPTAQASTAISHPRLDPHMASRLPLRLLLAEDNLVNQKVALRTLEHLGYRADVVANGLEVLDALERQPYDVILMDVQMPEMDGLEATRRIGQRWPPAQRPRIVAMTANAMQGDREQCLQAGMDDYISKPVRMEELIAVLERSATSPTAEPADASAAQARPAIDHEALMRLLADLGDDPTIIVELIDLFLQDAPTLLADLRQGVATSQAELEQRAAHTLKSTSASLGAQALSIYCHDMEKLADEARLDQGSVMLAQIEAAYAQAEQGLQQIRADMAV